MFDEKELRKLRRQRRLETQKEKREQIRLGLLPPEESKLKMSNYMKVIGQEALQEPTKAEAMVRKQMQKRIEAHEKANAERALSVEDRRAKKRQKWKNTSSLHHCVCFRVEGNFLQFKFKIIVNANQMQLAGVALNIIESNFGFVIVEGGIKSITRFSKLMLRRIKWTLDQDEESGCSIVWQGTFPKSQFSTFEWKVVDTETEAYRILKKDHLEHLLKVTSGSVTDVTTSFLDTLVNDQ